MAVAWRLMYTNDKKRELDFKLTKRYVWNILYFILLIIKLYHVSEKSATFVSVFVFIFTKLKTKLIQILKVVCRDYDAHHRATNKAIIIIWLSV